MQVVVLKKTIADKVFFYPRNAAACIFCELLGQKTLTKEDLEIIALLGFEAEVLNA